MNFEFCCNISEFEFEEHDEEFVVEKTEKRGWGLFYRGEEPIGDFVPLFPYTGNLEIQKKDKFYEYGCSINPQHNHQSKLRKFGFLERKKLNLIFQLLF